MPEPAVSPLAEVRQRIAATAKVARREADEITLVAVSKTQPVEAIHALIVQGQRVFGENRVQEAQAKWPDLREANPDVSLALNDQLVDCLDRLGFADRDQHDFIRLTPRHFRDGGDALADFGERRDYWFGHRALL